MKSKIYKNLLNIIICLFLGSAANQVFSQEIWTPTSTGTNVPSSRSGHSCVWTGASTNKMIIWGGAGIVVTNTGGIYDPVLNSWTVTSIGANCPLARSIHTTVWTGSKMIVWGGFSPSPNTFYNTGGIYDPVLNTWIATSTSGAPAGRFSHTAVWTGSKMIVWGGSGNNNTFYNTGGIYDPVTDTWTAMSTINAPTARGYHTAIWTGSKMIVWGGDSTNIKYNTGGIYDPVSDTWVPTSVGINVPSIRDQHTAVWTGNKMIIWGGFGINFLNNGGLYDPVTDSWTVTSIGANCPTARSYLTSVWTGSRMIVWGGASAAGFCNTGGIYDPIADSWDVTSTLNAPTPRDHHTMIITSNSMIIWGGGDFTGGVYSNPAVIGINQISTEVPSGFSLSQNYPNPFNPNSKIKFQIAKSSFAKLIVFDVLGREVSTLVNQQLKTGTYEVDFDGSKLSSGVYFYKLETGEFVQTRKMILVK